ncbi:hypothetical protein MNAN1_003237 [Malassezia nana]|uniref:Uncharacterized protein n=1 Tax=Malassezia nana TaxID=180528 RepID=A0AAF0ESW0_9BASI|nr:hypothetical protein MNAN1_003237 [Malassezia nana]
MPRPAYIVEHMEEDEPGAPAHFAPWALLEYRHMLYHVGEGTTVYFTSLSQGSLRQLEEAFSQPLPPLTRPARFELHAQSVASLARERGWAMESICLLDPKAPLPLSVCDAGLHESSARAAHGEAPTFTHFLFGGILGDDPPRDRTASLRELGFPGRHLGRVQMSTDTAVGVTKRVVEDGLRLGLAELEGERGVDGPSDGTASRYVVERLTQVELPYRYLAQDATTPLMAPGMRTIIYRDFDRTLEFS